MDTSSSTKKTIIGLGNPIMDIVAPIEEDSISKYNLRWGQTVMCNDDNVKIYEEVEAQKEVTYIPGGSVTNSIRLASVYNLIIL
jgi:adenosine kinase